MSFEAANSKAQQKGEKQTDLKAEVLYLDISEISTSLNILAEWMGIPSTLHSACGAL